MKNPGTIVRCKNGDEIHFRERLSKRAAKDAAARVLERTRMNPVSNLAAAIAKFKRFHGKEPRGVRKVPFKRNVSFFQIGLCPEIHYLSDKEKKGKMRHYFHKVRTPGKLSMSTDGKFFVIENKSTFVTDWLREKGGEVE